MAKNAPASGALKVAEMPPAAPQATSRRTRSVFRRSSCASADPAAEPIWTMGPSRPTEPPPPMHNADASALTTVTCGRDAAAAVRDGVHHLGHAVATGFRGETMHERPVHRAGDDGREQQKPEAQRRPVSTGAPGRAPSSRRSR